MTTSKDYGIIHKGHIVSCDWTAFVIDIFSSNLYYLTQDLLLLYSRLLIDQISIKSAVVDYNSI